MRLKAYILAADPAWIENSIASYYSIVDEIIVSFDKDSKGYTGALVTVDECIKRLQSWDCDAKIRLSPGHYARLDHTPMENETYQRQCALDEASVEADWVLQMDTDEVIADTNEFKSCLEEAVAQGFSAMDYPSRWLYRQLGGDRYLEACSRFWGITASYPGAIAVKAGTRLRLARQCDERLYRVDFQPKNTDPWRPADVPVHRVIRPNQAIIHYSMVRDEEVLRRKLATWSHAKDRDWMPELNHWNWCGRHPYLAAATTPFLWGKRRHAHRGFLRMTKISLPPTTPSTQELK